MPTGIRKRNYELKNGNAKEKARAKTNREGYDRFLAGKVIPRIFHNGRTTSPRSAPAKTSKKMKAYSLFNTQIPAIGTDITKTKKVVRLQINAMNASLKTLRNKYKELVALEKLMKDITRG
tara:strand:+ start:417 stop:779 length:363 start_codon:yes stop_codon:yes gene_type:complete